MAREDQTVTLPDRRTVGYAEYGAADGLPIIACHGTPGSRLMLRATDVAARALGLRIIAPDRPGYGLSSPRRRSLLTDWPDDVAVLVDRLGIRRFAVVGVSGGSPYALACAWKMPERVRLVAVISGLAPLDQAEVLAGLDPKHQAILRSARSGSALLRAMLAIGGRGWRHAPAWMLQRFAQFAPAAEHRTLAMAQAQSAMLASFREAFRTGSQGVGRDLLLFSRPWGFSVEQIAAPAMLWHGEADAIVPVAMGRYLARHLPNCAATFIADAGHYWIVEHVADVLGGLRARLAGDARRA